MQHTLRVNVLDDLRVVEVLMEGEMIAATALDALRVGLATARPKGITRVMLDITRTLQVGSFMDAYDGAKNLAEVTGMHQAERCAVIYDPRRYAHTRASTMEATAENWGNPPLSFFDQRAAALRWLTGGTITSA